MSFWQSLPHPILTLAPMAGYTDSAFRLLCRANGADLVYSEMISADALAFGNKKTIAMLDHNSAEMPLVIQLFGSRPDKFAAAVSFINKKFAKQKIGLDINFGCPAKKIIKIGSGAALMNELDKAFAIIKIVCQTSDFPVSLKIRAKVKNVTALDFVAKIKNLPWEALMIHGRTLNEGFNRPIDFNLIKKIKKMLPQKIILANGGIVDLNSAKKTLEATTADGLGLARGVLGRPWLFQEIKNGQKLNLPLTEINKIMLMHATYFLASNKNLITLRKHLIHYFKGQKNASTLRQKIIQTVTLDDLKKILS